MLVESDGTRLMDEAGEFLRWIAAEGREYSARINPEILKARLQQFKEKSRQVEPGNKEPIPGTDGSGHEPIRGR